MLNHIIIGGFAVLALLFIWFKTSLSVVIMKRIPKFLQGEWYETSFDDIDREYMTRSKYFEKLHESSLPPKIIELVNCHICLGTWFSVLFWLCWCGSGLFENSTWFEFTCCTPLVIFAQLGVGLLLFTAVNPDSSNA